MWNFDSSQFWNRGRGKVLSINVGQDDDIEMAVGKSAIVKNLPNRYVRKDFFEILIFIGVL